jgi:hypothetical protein
MGFSDLVAGVGDEVEALVHRLPDGVDLIERVIADGADLDELDLMLDSLPDDAEIAQLTGALNNPAELKRLLAARDAEAAAHAVDRGRKPAE